ncbi:MAG TPA: O-antigen ligase family protein [Gaiellaceae bacterium]|nr:O-antigen ligase family protein [Gaiellaceae bacterium]
MDSASEPSARPSATVPLVLAALVGASLASAMFAGDGSGTRGTLPVGGGALLLLTVALVLVAFGRISAPRLGRAGAVLLGSFVLLVAWLGATVWWSIVPDRSWDTFNKSVAYVAFLGLGFVLAGLGRAIAVRLAASMLAIVIGTTLVWALVTKAVPAFAEDERVARLNEPVDHWNALALLADVAIVLGLWLATTDAHRRVVRVAGGLLVYVATLALLLTLSRAGVVVGVAVIGLWLALTSERVQSGLVLVASAGPALLVAGWAFTRDALTEDLAPRADRVADGAVFGVLALVGALVVLLVVSLALRRSLDAARRRVVGRWLIAIAAVLVVAAAVGASVAAADAVSSGRKCAEVVNDPSRFGSLDVSNRLCWWEEAVDVYRAHAPEGAGAGTFEIARKRFRPNAETVLQPHSVPLQQLADGGVVALGLFLVVILAGIAVCICAVRRLSGHERTAAVALVAAPAAYLGHSLVDYNWDFLAVTAPTMVALGSLAAAGREALAPRRRPVLGVGIVVLAALVLVSFSFPRLADRAERRSTRALADGDLRTASDEARWAHFFNPASADPLYARARVAEVQGVDSRAERYYIKAVELQPDNPLTWYTLGIFEFEARRNLCAAYRFLNNAYTLDPKGNQWTKGSPLDVARDAVNEGGCAPGS